MVRKDPTRHKGIGEDLYEQWNAYNYLSQNYNRQHFLLGPPFEQNISEAFAYKLNSLASRGNHKDGGDRYLSDHPVVVQKVKRAPDKSIMIRCHPDQQNKMQTDLRNLLASFSGNKLQSFAQQLRKGLTTAIYVMEQEPWYANDWQALSDTNGTVVDIDVSQIRSESRGKEFDRLDWIDLCCNSFEEILRQVMPADNATICSTNLHSLRLEDLNKKPVYCDDDLELCHFGDSKNPHVGYLVANTTNEDARSVLESNWKVARMLTNDYKINHNILGSPQQVNSSTLMVQKVKRFPSNKTLLFTCNNKLTKNSMFGGEEVDSFIGYIKNSKLFKYKVRSEVKRISNMMEETNQSLDANFKARVDSAGHVYLLNLHNVTRKKRPTSMSIQSHCLKVLRKWAESVVQEAVTM